MSTDAPTGSMPNRQHYLKAAVVGGGASALLSLIPVINWLNVFFFCLIIAGGVLAVQQVQVKTGTVTLGEGAVIGALSGAVCGLFLFVLGLCVASLFSLVFLPDASGREAEEALTFMSLAFAGSCCFGIIVYPLFGAIGGVIATFIWPPDAATPAGAEGEQGQAMPGGGVMPPAPSAEDVAKRKRMIRIVLSTLGGCFGVMVGFCALCGYLAILENRDPDDTAGEDAVVETNLVVGQPALLELPGSGSYDSRSYAIWLVADDDLPASLAYSLDGRIGCREQHSYGGGELNMHDIYSYRGPDDDEPSWILLDSHYAWGPDSIRCGVLINELPAGVTNPRIVITRLTRPSDWFD